VLFVVFVISRPITYTQAPEVLMAMLRVSGQEVAGSCGYCAEPKLKSR
jgi:hypothetical protein